MKATALIDGDKSLYFTDDDDGVQIQATQDDGTDCSVITLSLTIEQLTDLRDGIDEILDLYEDEETGAHGSGVKNDSDPSVRSQ